MNAEEQLAAVTMQALNASKKLSRSQPHVGGSSEGTGVLPGVPDESTVILTTSSEGTCTKSGVPDKVKGSSEVKEEEKKYNDEDDRSIDIKKFDDDEETDDEFVHGDEYVHDVDEEMKDAEDAENWKNDEEITNAEKTDVTKGDLEQARKLPLTSSSLSMSSSFGNQFLNLSSDTSLIVTPAKTPLPLSSVFTITHVLQQTTTPILIPPITIVALAATTVPDPLLAIAHRVPAAKDEYLGSSLEDALQKETSKGDTLPNTSKTGKSASTKESVKEATHELTMGDEEPVQENVNDVDEPQDGEAALKNDWFKQPPRPPTLAPEWNKCQVVDDQP
nr:hypothetical protein [Tanacetum cinerariifolium]